MFKLIKYLKRYYKQIFIILCLLVSQAMCDLALPTYTSDIINVGVQQRGIDEVTPKVIRKSELDKILLLVHEKDISTITDNYKLLEKSKLSKDDYESYLKKYPLLDKETLYVLDTKDKEVIKEMGSILAKPILVLSALSSESDMSSLMSSQVDLEVPEGVDLFQVLSMMDTSEKEAMLDGIDKKFESMQDMIIEQAAFSYVRSEYSSVGIDVDKVQTNYILVAGAKMIALSLISMATTIIVGYIGAKVAAKLAKRLRGDVFKKVLSFSTTEIKQYGTASLITRSTNDIQQIQTLIVMMLRMVIYAPVLGVGAFIKVLNTNYSMSWIIGVAVGSLILVMAFMFLVAMPKFTKLQKLVDKLNLVTREFITGIPVIRAFSNQRHEEKRFDKANTELKHVNLFVNRVMSAMMPIMMLIMNVVTLLIIWNGAKGIDAGTFALGDMMAFIQYTMQIIMAFIMISMISIFLPRALVSVKRIDEVLTTEIAINDPEDPKKFDKNKRGLVEFKNVSFRYPDADMDVIMDINFTAKKGEVTAFIGSTGSGKSTLINLIPRLFDVTEGEILVDGVNVKDVTQHDLHSIIGYIPQKGVLFSGNIESNIKFGSNKITDEEMVKAARVAQAENFIEGKEDKYLSEISQGGTNVSGGQKQRLSIARAIAISPEIYIFDDSFSALDFKTDAALRKDLSKHTKDSTVLIVAQRISTIMTADQIIVLDEGRVVGKGRHEELMKSCDVYKEIAYSQLSKEELGNE